MNVLETFDPLLSAALERYQRFNHPEPRDLERIFGPVFATICNLAGSDPNRATELISAWDPTTITVETVRGAVAQLTAPAMGAMALARAHQAELEAELAADAAAHPLTARDCVVLERTKPLAERSRQSIEDELYECNRGKTRDGVKLQFVPCGYGHPHYDALTQELDRRDHEAAGVEYVPPAKDERPTPALSGYIGPRLGA